ncbi:MAG TPA: hypothetical protein ENJ95_19760 [Bacteroidetes bacterium]|nr:hypothetical protein [Bacteroidota bacterium]
MLSFIAYHGFSSFRHEVETTKETIVAYIEGCPVPGLSDRGRIASIETGIEIGVENFWLGTGIGDLKKEMSKHAAPENRSNKNPLLLPHNQFVFFFAFSGIMGMVWFGLVWFGLVIFTAVFEKASIPFLYRGFNIIVVSSFFFDHTLETQIGIGFWLVFLLVLRRENKP